jgi:S-DNA-T family DNA segregation ATPase FtsK/SpoIIIE
VARKTRKSGAAGGKARSPKRESDPVVAPEQRREILSILLLAGALFLLLSLVPVEIFGERGVRWFSSGNIIGAAGGVVAASLSVGLGIAAWYVPGLVAVFGLRVGDRLSPASTFRFAVLFVGLLLITPSAVFVVAGGSAAGVVGRWVGDPMVRLVGPVGAMMLDVVLLVALSVATLRWNPLVTMSRGVLAGTGAAGKAARAMAEKGKELKAAHQAALAAEEQARLREAEEAPIEGFEPTWLGPETGEDPQDEGETQDGGTAPVLTSDGEALDPGDVAFADGVAEVDDVIEDDEDDGSVGEDDDHGLADPNAGRPIRHEVPPVDLLSAPEVADRASMERQLDHLGQVLVEKLQTFNVQSELGGRTTGPVVTQFEVVPAPGVKVNRIANLDADLALAMKAKTIRIVAPIPGKGAVGVEIPNPQPEIVNLREILEARPFRSAKGELPLALGKDLNGKPYVAALEKMPHVLIAGATGAGKSVCLNTIVTSLVYRHTPETLRLLMIDPKMVELSVYSRLPHLRHNVVTDPRDAAGVLKWAVLEMERRYMLLKQNHLRSIQEFNKKVGEGQLLRRVEPKGPEGDENRWIYSDGPMPYMVVVVDELADLMMTVQSEVEKPLTQLAQKARAIGIHLIVATQRPSVNVITGLIKANFPTRIAFRVASKTDSRTILDQNGADALLGNGDMLFLPPGQSAPVRIQGAYLPTEDTEKLMSWYVELLEKQGEEALRPVDEPDILEEVRGQELDAAAIAAEDMSGDWDDLFRAAAEVCIQNRNGSTSLLQRKLSIGYGRAARIVDQLELAEVLGPSDGAKGREVLMTMDELEAMFGAGA